ncbi:MAG: DEAD/DEAH box helicase [Planctomycetes bacterium]|nr:DEAD/DEAH box helicase [Planctomycetota bacterium]
MALDTAEFDGIDPDAATTVLDGVGPKVAARLAAVGVRTIAQLLLYFPRRHVEYGDVECPSDDLLGRSVRITGSVTRVRTGWLPGRRSIVSVTFSTADGTSFRISFFNQPYLAKSYRVGVQRRVEGRLDKSGATFVLENARVLPEGAAPPGPLVMHYRDVEGVSESRLRTLIRQALERTDFSRPIVPALPPRLGGAIRAPAEAIRAMHVPRDAAEHERARAWFALLEAVELFRGLEAARRRRIRQRGPQIPVGDDHAERMREVLPFDWTDDQAHAVSFLHRSLAEGPPFGILLHGDVGTGKTAVALDAAVATVEAGYQVALLAPTELLAEQHAASLGGWLDRSGLQLDLLVGGLPANERVEVATRIADGRARFVVGTHALLSEQTEFARLGLVIIDEQHRFGVDQRARLVAKGRAPHVLVMTATPIPRTLALTLFGDLDAVALRDRPPGRRMSPAVFVPRERWSRVLRSIERTLRRGGRVYVVCPKVGQKGEKGGAVHVHRELSRRFACALVHGRQRAEERQRAIAAFRDGTVSVLVGTTVLEVGVDVPAATLMVVTSAERFGMATLHQLRGRVGRGVRRGLCILTGHANARTAAVCRSLDGFSLAEEDLRLRGAGELLGVRQSGALDFRALDPIADFELLERARRAVRAE